MPSWAAFSTQPANWSLSFPAWLMKMICYRAPRKALGAMTQVWDRAGVQLRFVSMAQYSPYQVPGWSPSE